MIRDAAFLIAWAVLGVSVAVVSEPAWGVVACACVVLVVCVVGMVEQYRKKK